MSNNELIRQVMEYTGWSREEAAQVVDAMEEAQTTFNATKKANVETTQVSRRTLYVLMSMTGAFLGMQNLALPELQ